MSYKIQLNVQTQIHRVSLKMLGFKNKQLQPSMVDEISIKSGGG
jgi:hypothetical protein